MAGKKEKTRTRLLPNGEVESFHKTRPLVSGKEPKLRRNSANRPTGHSSKSMARPKLELCEEHIRDMAEMGMTDEEMCHLLKVSKDRLTSFRPIIQEGRANLSCSIKRVQIKKAIQEKDNTMLMWIGKQYCGQNDKRNVHHTSNEGSGPQVIFYSTKEKPKTWEEEQKEKES